MMDGMAAQHQIQATFNQLAPLLQAVTDQSLKLDPNPNKQKKAKNEHTKGKGKSAKPPDGEPAPAQLAQAMLVMSKLLIRLDRDLQSIKQEDSFLLFFNNKQPTGALPILMKAAQAWHQQQQEEEKQTPWMPLRQKLFQTLFNELLTKITQLGEASPQSDLIKAAVQQRLLLEDRTMPFLEWSRQKQCLQVSKIAALSLRTMKANIEDLIEASTEPSLIKAFHALPAGGEVTPWRLQLSPRSDREFLLLKSLTGSSAWTLMGTSLKLHNQMQSSLATQLSTLMVPKGKGKGKGT